MKYQIWEYPYVNVNVNIGGNNFNVKQNLSIQIFYSLCNTAHVIECSYHFTIYMYIFISLLDFYIKTAG